jgi:hypothetical protein
VSASHIPYWEYDREAAITCPRCGWSGPAGCGEDFHQELLDVTRPSCSQMLLIVPFPTTEETRAAAAAGNPLAQAEIPNVDNIEKRWETAAETALTGPHQLPEIRGDDITIVWDFEEREGEKFTVLRHGGREIWRELAYWEGIERFEEVTGLLEQRYGRRLVAFEPTSRSELYLYGDKLSAPRRVAAVNARLGRPTVWMQETDRGIEIHGLPGPPGSPERQDQANPEPGEPPPDVPEQDRPVSPVGSVKSIVLTTRYTDAVEYARSQHADDVRKGTAIPYIAHVLAVSSLVLEHGGGEMAAIAALLHDVVEDGGGENALAQIAERFGSDVAAIVEGCSDTTAVVKEDWTLRKERYLEHLESAPPDVLRVSASDKLHNARAILSDLREHGDELWARFNRGPREQLWYYTSLRDTFLRRLPGRLASELDRTMRDINRLLDPQDRIEWLGVRFELWHGDDERGGIVDWAGCPVVIAAGPNGIAVRAQVGVRGDYCPDVDGDLADYVDAELGDLRLEYVEPAEVAWLICDDRGDLRESCDRVAALVPTVVEQLRESAAELDPPITSFDERVEAGPW